MGGPTGHGAKVPRGLPAFSSPGRAALATGLVLIAALPPVPAVRSAGPGGLLGPGAAKVDGRVWAAAAAGDGFLVRLEPPAGGQPDVDASDAEGGGVAAVLRRRGARRMAQVARALADLSRRGHVTGWTTFPVAGVAAVEGDAEAVRGLARVPGVAEVRPDARRRLPRAEDPVPGPAPGRVEASPSGAPAATWPGGAPTWNVRAVGAPRVWQRLGVAGEGVVVAILDSGVDWTHPALQGAYRGRRGDHDHNWIDLTSRAAGQPTDPFGHGTHVAGLVVGHDSQTIYGVAPGAQWIAARVFDATGTSRDSWLLAAGEWVLAPTDRSGRDPRPVAAPDVVNASWVLENGADPLYRPLVAAWQAAGIVPVFAAGNDDRGLGTYAGILAPASYPEALGVGALDSAGRVWYRSLGGPSFYGGVAPDLVAPGVDTVSTEAGGSTGRRSGTSMAAPHVAATAALMLSAQPGLRPVDVERFLGATAGDVPPLGPDEFSGYGALDAYSATEEALMAGRVAGTVAAHGSPVAGATVRGITGGREWWTTADSRGAFDVAARGGEWRLEADAFGWRPSRRRIAVSPGVVSRVDFDLRPAVLYPVTATVKTELGDALDGARVAVAPAAGASTAPGGGLGRPGGDGTYRLALPEGRHVLRAEAPGRRTVTATVEAPNPGAGPDFVLPEAPRLLVVDADAFLDERIFPYLTRGLEAAGFPTAVWVPGDLAAVQTPHLARLLSDFDVVLWSHRALSPGLLDRRRGDTAVTGALAQWVASGGRLILTGQDVGRYDSAAGSASNRAAPRFYSQVLAATWQGDWSPSRRVVGRGDFEGLDLVLDAPRGYRRGGRLAPDVVAVAPDADGADLALVYPPAGAAPETGAAVAASGPEGRRLYMAFGPEGAGSEVARAALLARAVEWVAPPDVVLTAPRLLEPGETAPARIRVFGAALAQPAVVTVTLPVTLTAVGPFTGGLAAVADGRLAWSGELPPRGVLELGLGVRFREPHPGGRPIDVLARLQTAARGRISRAPVILDAPDLSPSAAGAEPRRVPDGGSVDLIVALGNQGPAAADAEADLRIGLGLDPDAGSVAVTSGQAEWEAPRRLRWRGEVAPGAGVTVSLAAEARGPGALTRALVAVIDDGAGLVITRSAAVVVGGADLSASRMSVSPGDIAPGRPATVTLLVANAGAGGGDARARLAVPPGLTVLPPGAEEWRGWVAPRGVATATWRLATAATGPRGRQTVTATLEDGLVPPRPVIRSAALDVRRPDLGASRVILEPARVPSGTTVTSTVLVGNRGDAAAGAEAAVALPPALVLEPASAVASAGDVVPGTAGLTWRVTVAPKASSRRWRVAGPGAGKPPPGGPVADRLVPGESVALGLAFPLAGEVYTRAWVTGDGLVAFRDPGAVGAPSPRGPGVPALAPLWQRRRATPRPQLDRRGGQVWIHWPGSAGDVWVRLGWRGDFTFGYGPRVVPAGGWVGWRGAETLAAGPGWGGAVPGGGIEVPAPDDWEVLRFGAVVARAVGPNTPVTHTVGLSTAGRASTLVAGLVANRLSLGGTRLVSWPAMRTPGSTATYTLALRANGDVAARGVEAEIRLPPGVSLAADPEGLEVDPVSGSLVWQGTLVPGAGRDLHWQGRLTPTLAPGSRVVTTAVVRADGLDPVLRVLGQRVTKADFSGSYKRVSPAVAAPGRRLDFLLRAVNSGPDATRVELTDALAPGLEFIATSARSSMGPPPEWDGPSSSLRWKGEVGAGQAVEVRLQARLAVSDKVRNVMHLTDGAGSAYAAWAEVHPTRDTIFLPWLATHPP